MDKDGKESEFYIFQIITVGSRRYAILAPWELPDEPLLLGEAVPFRIEQDDDGEDILVEIEDDEEFELVEAAWDECWNDEDEDEPE